ncbi:RNA polymerase sigma factor [Patescibacteria group bacterium]|nr:RNA polymerase sigma factor [Patescibacteria group bacterium]
MKNKENHPKDAFVGAFDLHSNAIFRYCLYRIGDREKALDMSQDTFMKAWKFISLGGSVENMKAFLYKIATNLIIDEYRRRKSPESLDNLLEEKGFEPSIDEYEHMINRLDAEQALAMLSQIPEPYKQALGMRFVEDLSLKEISEITGESENTIAVRIHRGLAKLVKIFKHQND